MSDSSPEGRLATARAVEAWLAYQLGQTRQAIPRLEAEVAEQERRREVAYRESRFTIEQARSEGDPDTVHRGGCGRHTRPLVYLTAQEMASTLGSRRVVGCEACNPMPGLRGTWAARVGDDEGA